MHTCHAIACSVKVSPRLLMCRKHWYMVPKDLQTEVWRTYNPGQEEGKEDITTDYLIAAQQAICAVAVVEGHITQLEADRRIHEIRIN